MTYSNRQVAERLGISDSVLSKYLLTGKIPVPRSARTGGIKVYFWTETDIERVRKLLPKIKNGRKTRYQKKMEPVVRNQKSGKAESRAKEPQPRAPQPRHEQKQRQRTPGAPVAVPHKKKQK